MPKERRQRTVTHDSSVKLSSRKFAVQDNAVQITQVGSMPDASDMIAKASEILDALEPEPLPQLKKKEKQQLKHQAFVEKLESRSSPYSKSHARRLKRKAKESLVTDLNDVGAALSALSADLQMEPSGAGPQQQQSGEPGERPRPKPTPAGKIGEGKGMPLSKAQRKRALQVERIRQPLIRTNTTFASNPFETIRMHAQNTLVMHQKPATSADA